MAATAREQVITDLRAYVAPTFAGGLPLAAMRGGFEAIIAARETPEWIAAEPVDAGGVPAEWVSAPGVAADRALIVFHGGGYVSGSLRTERALAGRLARATGVRALSVDYRLAPEHPFPAAVEDALAAYRWLVAQGVAPGQVAVAGISAGGGLALALLLALRDAGETPPVCAVLISPFTDLTCSAPSYESRAAAEPILSARWLRECAAWYLAGQDPRAPLASPRFADLHGLPPLLIDVGDAELLLDDATGVAESARAAGVEVTCTVWPGMYHIFHGAAGVLPEAQIALDRIGAFVAQAVTGQA